MLGVVQYGSLPFDEQIKYFKAKANVPTQHWDSLWKSAHNRSFMVAGALKEDLLADLRKAVDDAISQGQSLTTFQKRFEHIVNKYGWAHTGSHAWRSQIIYETNIRQSYSAGRESQMEATKLQRPYGIYKHSGSEHPRLDHLSWNNLVLPLDDPWWETHTPINGYGCKCKKFSASLETVERLGLSVSNSPQVSTYEWANPSTGEIHVIPKGIDPGFDYTPKSSAQLTQALAERLANKVPLKDRLTPRVIDSAYSTVKGINAKTLSEAIERAESVTVPLVKQALDNIELKSLVLKAGELKSGAKAQALVDDINGYLGSDKGSLNFVLPDNKAALGLTQADWDHVVVKAKSTDSLKDITQANFDVLSSAFTQVPSSQVALVPAKQGGGATLVAYLNQVGRQIYFKAGREVPAVLLNESISVLASHSPQWWFSEYFVLYVLKPNELKQRHAAIYRWINDAVIGLIP